ncbi:MAG: hypothetical protein PHT14_09085 [Petrimonas sp.]|nr:hypothetical protein [Petrimonas mucosa]MDD2312681.1 hypothetical protein [Petrimonas sp.]
MTNRSFFQIHQLDGSLIRFIAYSYVKSQLIFSLTTFQYDMV